MSNHRQCNGFTRRDAIRLGVLGSATGLSISNYLSLADAGQLNPRAKSSAAIFVELPGGPSHIDTFDPKPQAPAEIRGKFRPIKTVTAGVEISEHLPLLARCTDKFAILRGVSHSLGAHPLGQKFVFTGNRPNPSLDYPAYGSVVAKEFPAFPDLPNYVAIPKAHQGPGHLGVQYDFVGHQCESQGRSTV